MTKDTAKNKNSSNENEQSPSKTMTCGIVRPISTIDSCSSDHWKEVHNIIIEALKDTDFNVNLVSQSEDSGIIQKKIIQNLYDNEIVICDVSCKNPNVMFELGMRLAFDKPTIIIKDDKTDYTFDINVIEHLEYPRDLRYSKINTFKKDLSNKVENTYRASVKDINYTTFLKNFGEFKVAKIEAKEVGKEEYIFESIKDLQNTMQRLLYNSNNSNLLLSNDERHRALIVRRQIFKRLSEICKNEQKILEEKDLLFDHIINICTRMGVSISSIEVEKIAAEFMDKGRIIETEL